MNVKIYESRYKNVSCLAVENERLRILVIPSSGGKLQSIFDKATGTEYLYQSPWPQYKHSSYDTSFGDGEISGFDEMFPTIVPCFYPDGPWAGARLPDHGEVWALPWDTDIDPDAVKLSANGVKLPYKLEKKARFLNANTIRIEYRATNHSVFPMKFIWAAHPLMNIDRHTVIVLPRQVDRVINTLHGMKRLGDYGRIHNWPVTVTTDGREYDMSILDPSNCDNDKYYVYGRLTKGECALYNMKTHNYIKLKFPVDKVPYLGIWTNENGSFLNQQNVALEPCTGALDSLEIADKYGMLPVVDGRSVYEWHLDIVTGTASNAGSVITED